MIGVGPSHRYFFYRPPTDMRNGIDGLCGLVKSATDRDPMSGDVFVFINRRRTLIKLLYWDRTGFSLFYKRLEAGTFELPAGSEPTWAEMVMLMDGVSLESVVYRRRYSEAALCV